MGSACLGLACKFEGWNFDPRPALMHSWLRFSQCDAMLRYTHTLRSRVSVYVKALCSHLVAISKSKGNDLHATLGHQRASSCCCTAMGEKQKGLREKEAQED